MTKAVVGTEVQGMFASIAERYDLGNSVLSGGTHHLWKRALIRLAGADPNGTALDLCTGTGDLLPLLARNFGRVVGADFCAPMLECAQEKLSRNGVLCRDGQPIELFEADALALPFKDQKFDLVTVAFGVRNLEDVSKGLSEIRRVLKPEGKLLVLEFGQPPNPVFGALYRFYSRYILPQIGGVITGNKAAYEYLPETAAAFPCGPKFGDLLRQSGYSVSLIRPVTFGIAYIYQASRSL